MALAVLAFYSQSCQASLPAGRVASDPMPSNPMFWLKGQNLIAVASSSGDGGGGGGQTLPTLVAAIISMPLCHGTFDLSGCTGGGGDDGEPRPL
jgi:hypothetical protein